LHDFYQIAKQKLNYVYLGNLFVKDEANTYCPNCKNLLIERTSYITKNINMTNEGTCKICGTKIYGIFK